MNCLKGSYNRIIVGEPGIKNIRTLCQIFIQKDKKYSMDDDIDKIFPKL